MNSFREDKDNGYSLALSFVI